MCLYSKLRKKIEILFLQKDFFNVYFVFPSKSRFLWSFISFGYQNRTSDPKPGIQRQSYSFLVISEDILWNSDRNRLKFIDR